MASNATTVTLAGTAFVILPAAEYERLRASLHRAAEEEGNEPPLPEPDARGRFPAIAYARASLARKIRRRRIALGISQTELARRAGLRLETLNRLEKGRTTPTIVTVDKIDRALREAEAGQAAAHAPGRLLPRAKQRAARPARKARGRKKPA